MREQDTISIEAKIDPREIAFLNSIASSYEGLMVLRTIDAKRGLVEFWVSPDFEREVRDILKDLADRIGLVILQG